MKRYLRAADMCKALWLTLAAFSPKAISTIKCFNVEAPALKKNNERN